MEWNLYYTIFYFNFNSLTLFSLSIYYIIDVLIKNKIIKLFLMI